VWALQFPADEFEVLQLLLLQSSSLEQEAPHSAPAAHEELTPMPMVNNAMASAHAAITKAFATAA
jgi:hypothetical protein